MTQDESYNNYLSHQFEGRTLTSLEKDREDSREIRICVECFCMDLGSPREFNWLEYSPCQKEKD